MAEREWSFQRPQVVSNGAFIKNASTLITLNRLKKRPPEQHRAGKISL
jgi:hypothetical protein